MSDNFTVLTAITTIVVALLGGGGIIGIIYGRKTVVAQADSINVATAQNVVKLVNAQLEHSKKEHKHERDMMEAQMKRERADCQRQLDSLLGKVQVLQGQLEKLLKS